MKTKTYSFRLNPWTFARFMRMIPFWLQSGADYFANANEITISFPSFNFSKSGVTITILPGTLNVSVIGLHSVHDVVTLTTADAILSKGNIGTLGVYFVWNHDSTNAAQMGGDGTTYPLAANAGEASFGRWNAAAFHAKSTAGSPQLEYCLIEA
jgi:hypothetical protein